MRFEDLNAQTLGQIGTAEAVARARQLVQEQQVQHGYALPDRILGVVWDEEVHQVEAKIKDDQLSFMCPCSQAERGEICDHVLALLWAWVEEPGRFLNRADLKERLKKYSKQDLVEIIIDLADRVPEVRGVLKEEGQGLEEILESIDHIMEDVASDSMDPADAENKLRRAQAWADRLAQSGHLAEARAIYFYMLDNLLALEERLSQEQLFSPELKEEFFEEYCQFIHEDRHLERELVEQELEQLESRAAVTRGELDLAALKQELRSAV
ncbi:MAG: hypothetical protein AB1491_13600 [Thermodesulfobacteriota bacterium]